MLIAKDYWLIILTKSVYIVYLSGFKPILDKKNDERCVIINERCHFDRMNLALRDKLHEWVEKSLKWIKGSLPAGRQVSISLKMTNNELFLKFFEDFLSFDSIPSSDYILKLFLVHSGFYKMIIIFVLCIKPFFFWFIKNNR